MTKFFVKFSGESKKVEITKEKERKLQGELIKSEKRDRRIVGVLRKYLDMEFRAGELEIQDRTEFEALGELLFDLIFYDDNAKNKFMDFYEESYNDKENYGYPNIYLEFDKNKEFNDLAILPWEYIYFKPKPEMVIGYYPFLAADSKIEFNFYRKLPFTEFGINDQHANDPDKFQITPPLKILLILAQPSDKRLMKGKLLLEKFAQLACNDMIELRFLAQPTENFEEELQSGKEIDDEFKIFELKPHDKDFKPDIIHFVGHGQVKNKNGILLFVGKDKYESNYTAVEMKDEDFASAIANAHLEPKLVFLHVCNGGRIIDYINDQGIAIRLLLKKIPFVIAMQNPIEEDQALIFAEKFYERFLAGDNIGLAVTKGRCLLGKKHDYNRKSFGSPVLYTYVEHPLQLLLASPNEKSGRPREYKVCPNRSCKKNKSNFIFSIEDNLCSICGSRLVTGGDQSLVNDRIATPEADRGMPAARNAQSDTISGDLAGVSKR